MTADRLVRGVKELQSLPEIYVRVNEVIERPTASASDIGSIVGEDPGLSSRLLRLVNSAYFGFPGKIDTLTWAVSLIGTTQLRDLALATCVIQAFEGVNPDLVDMKSFWRHSLACGVTARVLATLRREDNVERFFVGGLLHDVGSVILYLQAPKKSQRALERVSDNGMLLSQAERQVVGFDHASAGGELLKMWRLPAILQEMVSNHHTPHFSRRFPREVATVHVAEAIADALEVGTNGEVNVSPVRPDAWEQLNLPPCSMPKILHDIDIQFEAIAGIMLDSCDDE